MSEYDFQLAKKIYLLSRKFELPIALMIASFLVLTSFVVSTILQNFVFDWQSVLLQGIYAITAMFGLVVVIAIPFTSRNLLNARKSLAEWQSGFLRFALTTGMESFPIVTQASAESLVGALISANPEYEQVLDGLGQSERDEATSSFKNLSLRVGGRTASFDVLIGWLSDADVVVGMTRKKIRDWEIQLSQIGVTAGRILNRKPEKNDYVEFANDLRFIEKIHGHNRGPIIRAVLVSTAAPSGELIEFAKHEKNWPKLSGKKIPISLVVQAEARYQVVFAN